jgi:hypothetical protein
MGELLVTEAMVTEGFKLGQAMCHLAEVIIQETNPEVKAANAKIVTELLKGPAILLEGWNSYLARMVGGQQ